MQLYWSFAFLTSIVRLIHGDTSSVDIPMNEISTITNTTIPYDGVTALYEYFLIPATINLVVAGCLVYGVIKVAWQLSLCLQLLFATCFIRTGKEILRLAVSDYANDGNCGGGLLYDCVSYFHWAAWFTANNCHWWVVRSTENCFFFVIVHFLLLQVSTCFFGIASCRTTRFCRVNLQNRRLMLRKTFYYIKKCNLNFLFLLHVTFQRFIYLVIQRIHQ